MKANHRSVTRSLLAVCTAIAAAVGTTQAHAVDAPDGIYASFPNLTNTSFVEYGVTQDGLNIFAVEDEVQGTTFASFSRNPSYGSEEAEGVFGVTGSASAESINGILRASAQAEVTDKTFGTNPAPYLTGDTSDPDGIPTTVEFTAIAGFTDRLQFGSTATGYTSRYLIRVTGEITAPGAFVSIDIRNGNGQTESYFFTEVGLINETIATNSVAVTGNQQEFGITVQATAPVFSEFDDEGFSAGALFGNTLQVIGLEVRDPEGALVVNTPEFSITTAGGAAPTITAVPEPASAALLAGLGLLAVRRRRTR